MQINYKYLALIVFLCFVGIGTVLSQVDTVVTVSVDTTSVDSASASDKLLEKINSETQSLTNYFSFSKKDEIVQEFRPYIFLGGIGPFKFRCHVSQHGGRSLRRARNHTKGRPHAR